MLSIETIEKAIEMYGGGATESAVAKDTGISPEEAKAVANALYLGETERLVREVALAGVLEAAAKALRTGRGLIGDTAGDVVREIWNSYPNAGIKLGETDRKTAEAGGFDQAEIGKDKLSWEALAIFWSRKKACRKSAASRPYIPSRVSATPATWSQAIICRHTGAQSITTGL